MRKAVIGCTVAFVTFTLGLIVVRVVDTPVVHDSKPAEQHATFFVETKPQEVKAAETDAKAEKQTDLSIVVEVSEPNPQPPSLRREYIKLVKRGPTVIDLDLAESIDNQEVTLNFRDKGEYRMFQRYRTSMSISFEGPHLDLIDWRHFDSPWVALRALSARRFQTLAPYEMDSSRFPPTTTEEILKEVRRRVGTDWLEALELVKECRGPNDGACAVMISSVYLRIQKRVGAVWTDAGLVEIRIPMGC